VIRKGYSKLHLSHEEWQLDVGRAGLATNNAVELYHLAAAKRDELLDDLKWMQSV
jgi:hypothetical protein